MSSESVTRNLGESPTEIVIVRRRQVAGREEQHGGIWKIAYADFMTALMAFFLVMWLLNATDRQTISAVASYFNPIRLTDRVEQPKGLHEADSGTWGRTYKDSDSSRADPMLEASVRPVHSEDELFRDPYGVLARLASLAAPERPEPARQAEGSAGEAFRDPFDPEFRFLARANAQEAVPIASEVASTDTKSKPAAEPVAAQPSDNDTGREPAPVAATESPASEIAQQIREALRQAAPDRVPHVEVTSTSDGILVSLTDEFDFGMFAIASAEPRPELVVVMEKVAQVLKSYPGSLVVRGHTDGRPFRTQTYDNWRLSSARAHMAYFMLVRGGVDEQRFQRIEGYADRSLKVAGEPEAAQNRRIEILLRKEHAS